jgi:phage baseplate assembly protein W
MAVKVEPFGVGVLRPFRRTPQGKINIGGGQALLASNVGQVLGTNPGEVRWRPSFGVNLTNLRQRANTLAAPDLARVSIGSAIGRWVKKVQLTEVVIEPITFGSQNRLDVTVLWTASEGKVSGVKVSA